MEQFFNFILKVSFSLSVFYLFYLIFLSRESFHSINRFYLNLSVIISCFIPLFNFNSNIANSQLIFITYELDNITILTDHIKPLWYNELNISNILEYIYISVALLLLLMLMLNLLKINNIIKNTRTKIINNVTINITEKHIMPFSFLNRIIINPSNISENELNKIITHEYTHIKQFHSIDSLFIEILCIILWFNPFVWFIKSSLKNIHEFLADSNCINNKTDIVEYSSLIYSIAYSIPLDLTNNFNNSSILRRVKMLSKNPSSTASYLKLLLAIPLLVTMIFAVNLLSLEQVSAKETKVALNQDAKKPAKVKGNKNAEQAPVLRMSIKEFAQFVIYPEEARKANKSGEVYVDALISENGTVKEVKIKKSSDKIFDQAAINAMKKAKFKPGTKDKKPVETWITMPIKFKLK